MSAPPAPPRPRPPAWRYIQSCDYLTDRGWERGQHRGWTPVENPITIPIASVPYLACVREVIVSPTRIAFIYR